MWRDVRNRARWLKIPFNIEPEDIVITTHCPVFGEAFDGSKADWKPTVDKIIPELGYIKGNIAVISMKANRLKNNASLAELEAIVDYLKNNRT